MNKLMHMLSMLMSNIVSRKDRNKHKLMDLFEIINNMFLICVSVCVWVCLIIASILVFFWAEEKYSY